MAEVTKLTKEFVKANLGKKFTGEISDSVIDEINLLIDDPDYGEAFKENMVTYTSVLSGKDTWSLQMYLDATKFFSLVSMGDSQAKAYCKVFPDRFQARLDRGEGQNEIAGEASRYNGSKLVNAIREQSQVPFHLRNQGAAQDALNQLLHLMMNARSDVAKVSAATAVLKETRPPEAQKIEMQVGLSDIAVEQQEKQNMALRDIAINQRKLIEQGYSIEEVQKIHVTRTHDTIDVDVEE